MIYVSCDPLSLIVMFCNVTERISSHKILDINRRFLLLDSVYCSFGITAVNGRLPEGTDLPLRTQHFVILTDEIRFSLLHMLIGVCKHGYTTFLFSYIILRSSVKRETVSDTLLEVGEVLCQDPCLHILVWLIRTIVYMWCIQLMKYVAPMGNGMPVSIRLK